MRLPDVSGCRPPLPPVICLQVSTDLRVLSVIELGVEIMTFAGIGVNCGFGALFLRERR